MTGDTFCVYFLFDMDLMVMLMRQGLHVLFIYDLCALFADMHMVACSSSWIHHTWYDLIYRSHVVVLSLLSMSVVFSFMNRTADSTLAHTVLHTSIYLPPY